MMENVFRNDFTANVPIENVNMNMGFIGIKE